MANQIQFGTINLPETFSSAYGNSIYTAPSILPKEMMDKISFSQDKEEVNYVEDLTSFDNLLKSVLSVPKP